MSKNALTFAATITAYILGIATGILVVKDRMERKYKKRSEDEIKSVKDAFEERLKKRTERSEEESAKINEIYTRLLEQARYKPKEEEAETGSMGAVVIPPDEFEEDTSYVTQIVVYYQGSGVFVNEDDDAIPEKEWEKLLGCEVASRFGENEDAPDAVYIRNDKLRAYYEVLLEEGEYSP